MKTAILSDVHSNLEALERCCAHACAQGAERFVCLGDMVGYGADPCATLDLLMSLPGIVALRGNHDEALFRDPGDHAPEAVRRVLAWTRAQLSEAQLKFLQDLPYVWREEGVTYAHASADQPMRWEYVRMPEQAERCLAAAGTPLVFIGHVHEPKIYYETAGGALRDFTPARSEVIPLSARSRYVVNVGSVGQPRDGDAASSYVLYDAARAEVVFHRLAYDYHATGRKIRAVGLSAYYADRLARGR
ncbi:MAG: metallophosphoesterase family protein [Pseudomonadota bacterium]|nr:MAG: metallophosphoesterase family protein [Pseudomonadota bacterium]